MLSQSHWWGFDKIRSTQWRYVPTNIYGLLRLDLLHFRLLWLCTANHWRCACQIMIIILLKCSSGRWICTVLGSAPSYIHHFTVYLLHFCNICPQSSPQSFLSASLYEGLCILWAVSSSGCSIELESYLQRVGCWRHSKRWWEGCSATVWRPLWTKRASAHIMLKRIAQCV